MIDGSADSIPICSRICVRRNLVREERLRAVPEHHLRPRPLLQHPNHLMTADPVVVVSGKPALRYTVFPVLMHVIHVCGKDPGTAVLQVHLHNDKARCVAWCVTEVYTLRELQERPAKGLPVQVEGEVVRKVDAKVCFGGHGVEGVLQLQLVDVDWDLILLVNRAKSNRGSRTRTSVPTKCSNPPA